MSLNVIMGSFDLALNLSLVVLVVQCSDLLRSHSVHTLQNTWTYSESDNITNLLQKINTCARQTCTITDNTSSRPYTGRKELPKHSQDVSQHLGCWPARCPFLLLLLMMMMMMMMMMLMLMLLLLLLVLLLRPP